MTGAARRLLGRYELIAEIASGGMGMVCLARAVGVGGFKRLFAIKVLHQHLAEEAEIVSMLLDEAWIAARIHHPNVVATVDIGMQADCHYLVMDYVDGFQLLDVMAHPQISREQRIRVAIRVLLDAMAGLACAHALENDDGVPYELVHRDLSPENILIGLDGIGRLTDFGIAYAKSRISASRPGTVKGKPSYMAPEQALARSVDCRADIWALGVILWEALVGRQLFLGSGEAATVLQVVGMDIESLLAIDPELPAALADVCMRALERDPALRYESARSMASDLERAALEAGLLGDTGEVADALRSLLGSESERRHAAIRFHSAALGPSSAPAMARDVYELPRLRDALEGSALPSSMLPPPPRVVRVTDEPDQDFFDRDTVPTPLKFQDPKPSRRIVLVAAAAVLLAGSGGGFCVASRFAIFATVALPSLQPRNAATEQRPGPAPGLVAEAGEAESAGAGQAPPPTPKRGPSSKAPAARRSPGSVRPPPPLEENPYGAR